MDGRQLRCFLAVVDHGSVTRAAEALYVSQPSLSQTIRSLERELGTELFHREGRTLRLSAAGQALLGPARQVQESALEASDAVRRIQQLEEGRLDIAVTEDLAVDPLADFVAAFRARHAEVWVNVLQADDSEAAAERVRVAECEVALCSLPVSRSGLTSVALGSRDLLLVLPPEMPLSEREVVPLSSLGDIPLVAGPLGDVVRDLVESTCAELKVKPKVMVEAGAPAVLPDLVLTGAGGAFLPPGVARSAANQGALVRRTDPPLVQDFGFVFRNSTLTAPSRAFLMLAQRAHVQARPDTALGFVRSPESAW
ncbi:LysR substrate-binding domain-containing protein [Saccharopolyspora shandongensis]|uniref:LysR family transcriptional regulator n=1 Tax=Saccharopolyspora shandongensis TaxID=418495 RepID=UPI0034021BDA